MYVHMTGSGNPWSVMKVSDTESASSDASNEEIIAATSTRISKNRKEKKER